MITPSLSPQDAWAPLPASEWNRDAISHLLRRAGWTALPAEVARAQDEGMQATLERLFPAKFAPMPEPASVTKLAEDSPYKKKAARDMSEMERREAQREFREKSRKALVDTSMTWLDHAAQPENSAAEKWVMFLGDIYVVGWQKVKITNLIYEHQAILRHFGMGPAPTLSDAVLHSPAMARYLDLQDSKRDAPNENFAREVMELFTLGIGNYTEKDIKEAARAFTGYRQIGNEVRFIPKQHDASRKTIFGATDDYDGDGVISLIYRQPAAATFVPREIGKYYLTDQPLPEEYFEPFKQWWPAHGFDLRQLALHFFGSRLFYAPEFRGNFIKSPVQFYLSLIQDINLDVAPLPRKTVVALRQMGQELYQPPNVRGWVGGRNWINSATLAARRQLVEALFAPLNEKTLNADELVDLAAARAEGRDKFTVTDDRITPLAKLDDAAIVDRFVNFFLPVNVGSDFRDTLTAFLAGAETGPARVRRVRNAAVTLLQSPEYQLC